MTQPSAPAAKGGSPPPAPTTPSPVSKPVLPCQAKASKPCDVDWLEVITTSSSGVVRKLATRKRWHDIDPKYEAPASRGGVERVVASVTAGLAYLLKVLNRDDFIIETIAELPHDDLAAQFQAVLGLPVGEGKPAMIQVNTHYLGDCPYGKTHHPRIVLKPVRSGGGDPTIDLARTSYGPVPYYANPVLLPGKNDANPFTAFLDFLTSLLAIGGVPKMIEVTADSCGVRAQGTPNQVLNAVVFVYPRDEWGILWVMPGFGEFKEESAHKKAALGGFSEDGFSKSRKLGVDGRSMSHTMGMDDGVATFSDKTVTQHGDHVRTDSTDDIIGEGWTGTVTTHSDSATKGTQRTTDATTLRSIEQEIDPATAPKDALTFKLIRNGEECKITEKIKEIMEAVRKWADKVKDALELLRRGPTIGWTATATVGIWKGTITGTWARTLGEQRDSASQIWVDAWTDRVLALNNNSISLSFDITVVEFKFEVAFGFTWMPVTGTFETGVDARIGGDFSLSSGFKTTVTDWKEVDVALTNKAEFNLWIKTRASAAGYTVGAELNLAGGFEASGKLIFDPGVRGEISGELKVLPMKLTGKVYSSADKVLFKLPDRELLPETSLGKFG